ncbi:MAG: tRNA (N6-isopentenyl adenosine(37)-C2)-methylthiotransferase MiaB [Clostridiales bacterium]|nr:tRNA (N6-isopentenyl adenosine(37)-C2)-methylthiotransferase MiaB [Clostridiales bacterium]
MRVFLTTYGCQANERDSETILGLLAQMGYEKTNEESKADLILLNTCSIRDKAEQKVFSYLGTLKQYKKAKPDLVIGLCGCMAQETDMGDLIRQRAPQVDFILGTHRLHRLPEMIRNALGGAGFQADQEETTEIVEALPSVRPYRFKALINITFGCDHFCSYCIVPYVRGRERSRRMEDILAESRLRVEEGAKELQFLGQNVNAYGKAQGHAGPYGSFADLLVQAEKIDGLERIRFLTSHPRDFAEDLIQVIAESRKVARHIHLPVQSGSNRILRSMNRGYDRETYLALTEGIRRQIPDVTLTTDIIVGFPGESDEDLQDTLDLLNQVGFGSAFTFMYSPRKGTPAAKMDKQIPLQEKRKRLQAVMEVQQANNLRVHQSLIGKELRVLAENWEDGLLSGRAEGNQLTYFAGEAGETGKFHQVRITKARIWTLEGESCGHG